MNPYELKQRQLDLINATNPAPDDYHTWIRSIDDILTFEEAVIECLEYDMGTVESDDLLDLLEDRTLICPDFDGNDAAAALDSGYVIVYSSYPIEDGVFVSTSYRIASDYAGSRGVYELEVALENVAWIDVTEGQYAKVQ
jgi:hypothetical protein